MAVTYLEPSTVQAVRRSAVPRSGQTRMGYGSRLPTSWELRVWGRWYRVRAICYSNAGSAYIKHKGELLFLGGFEPSEFEVTNG